MKNWITKQLHLTNQNNLGQLILQFIKFGLVGVSNTAISMGTYYLFLWLDPDLYLVGSVIGGVVSIANSFFWNDRFVFKGNDRSLKSTLKRLGRTYISYSGTGLFGLALLWLEVDVLGFNKAIVPLINLVITVPMNFLINKLWAFRKNEP